METYFNAGYFIQKRKEILFGANKYKIVETCSGCINFSVFDFWCLSWCDEKLDEDKRNELKLTDRKIAEIQNWTDQKFNSGVIKWGNAIPDLKTAHEFKNQFFKDQEEIKVYTVYFSQADVDELILKFENNIANNKDVALIHILANRTEEVENSNEEFLGFDFIGIEGDGSFHSFYCHDIAQTLVQRFNLKLNKFGLFDSLTYPQKIKEYLNDQNTGLEPVPWYIVKTKRINIASS